MSNLKKDIEDLVKKEQLAHCCAGMGCETASRLYADQIINLIESVIPEEATGNVFVEYIEGYNQAISDIKSKLIDEEDK